MVAIDNAHNENMDDGTVMDDDNSRGQSQNGSSTNKHGDDHTCDTMASLGKL